MCGSLDELRQSGPDETEAAFDKGVLCSPLTTAGGYPDNEGFGNLGRNVLRGLWQRRVDLSLAKTFPIAGLRNVELRWDVFNVFNTPNFALPNNVIGDATTDFGKITDTVGGPRVMQFGGAIAVLILARRGQVSRVRRRPSRDLPFLPTSNFWRPQRL